MSIAHQGSIIIIVAKCLLYCFALINTFHHSKIKQKKSSLLPTTIKYLSVNFQWKSSMTWMLQESSIRMGLNYIIASMSIFDEYSNDMLDMREGSCFPR